MRRNKKTPTPYATQPPHNPDLNEALRLRVKDLDFEGHQITIRDGKGAQDRISMLPESILEPLRTHLIAVEDLH